MENTSRSLTISESVSYHPKLTLTGAWFEKWGFTVGDKVAIRSPKPGTILIEIDIPSAQWKEIKRKNALQSQLFITEQELEYHKLENPVIYQKNLNKKGEVPEIGNHPSGHLGATG